VDDTPPVWLELRRPRPCRKLRNDRLSVSKHVNFAATVFSRGGATSGWNANDRGGTEIKGSATGSKDSELIIMSELILLGNLGNEGWPLGTEQTAMLRLRNPESERGPNLLYIDR